MKKVLYPLLTIAALAVVSMLVATINIVIAQDLTPTPGPELPTAVPACEAYYVSVGSANVRSCANSSCPIVTQLAQNTSVCIRGVADNSTWFRIDLSPNDTTSELYFIFDGNVSQGSSSGALPVYSRCQPFLTNDAVTTRQCPSASCTASGTLGGGEFVCGREYTGQLAGWIFAEESESGVVGWLEAGQLSPSRNYDASAERFVPTPGSSGISNTSASNIIPGVAPAPFVIEGNRPVCQQYHVTAVGANVRECPGMACRVVSTIPLGTGICIRSTTLNPDWYAIDLTPQDPASPIYAISKDVVSPGTNPQPLEVAVCDLYEVRTSGPRALVRQCPSVTCPAVDALDNGNLVCATAYGGEFRDWIQVQLDTGLTEVWMHESVLRSKAAEQELAAAATEAALPPTPISTSIPLQSFVPSPTPAIPINISPTPIITSGGAPGVASTGGTDGTTNGGAVNLSGGGVISSTAVPQVAINPTATPMLLSTVPVVVQQATAFLPNTSADINVNPGITQSGLATPFLPQTGVAGGSQSAGLSPTQVAQVATPFFQPSTIPQQAPAGTPTLLFQPTAPPIVNNTFLTPTAPTTQQQITVTTGGLLAQEVTLTSLGVT
ncbi:MAG TPA: hypothetical protein VJZ27_01710, partial [Aggregatilineales bacterium]|nr:hypothetical protein [Aggregatilineales bacterium]